MSKKKALEEFHRGAILAAAERLFAERGTVKTTMDDIARESEYSKATLYVYFHSKDEIVNTILLSSMVLLQKKMRDAISGNENWYRAYDEVCAAIIQFYSENPAAYEAIVSGQELEWDLASLDESTRDIVRAGEEITEIMADFLRKGTAEGAVRIELSPRETVLMLWAALSGIVKVSSEKESYIRHVLRIEPSEFLRHGTRMLLDAVTKGRTIE